HGRARIWARTSVGAGGSDPFSALMNCEVITQSSKFAISKGNATVCRQARRCCRRGSKALATRHVGPPIGPAKFARWRAALARDPSTFDEQRGVPLTIRGRLATKGRVAASHVTLQMRVRFSLPAWV